MCGIAGMVQRDGQPIEAARVSKMAQTLAHRGPDGEGVWVQGNVGLAHRRLAIVDVGPTGAQPMHSEDGSLSITFNGEIYNYQELRSALEKEGERCRTSSDTEVLLHLYAREGEAMLEKLHGMFAFAMWDAKQGKLFFARDRLGKKPFFYKEDANGFAFASELKALVSEKPAVDWQAIRLFLGLQYVPSPMTGFVGIKSLRPGECGTWKDGTLSVHTYDQVAWTPTCSGSSDEAAKEVRRLFDEAVRYRMIADVPVGAFLSGGVDSSVIASAMARQSKAPIKTFTMGFPSLGFDERAQARTFAANIGAEHHAFEARPEDALAAADEILAQYDAPYADSSSIPTWMLARETRKHVKAAMTGDGGDELFGGYRRYAAFATAARLKKSGLTWLAATYARLRWSVNKDPRWMRMATTLEGMRRSFADGYAELFTGSYFDRDALTRLLQPEFKEATEPSDAGNFVAHQFNEELGVLGALDFDLRSYLPDCLNVKMDRATMAHGLEARAPFLDQELVQFVTTLPLNQLLIQGKQKPLLRQALHDLVPEEIFDRPKRGFQVPLSEWFRGALRDAFVERCLSATSPLQKVCRTEEVKRYLEENDRGIDHGNRLWMLFSLATWLQRYG